MGLVVAFEKKGDPVGPALRALADRIDKGEFGEVACIAVAFMADSMHLYTGGEGSDPISVHFLLSAAATKTMQDTLEEVT